MKKMWEILVPTIRNDGGQINTRFHKVWDEKVRQISGGLTILMPARGQWVSPTGELFKELMIPVRVLATDDEMETIINITLKHYEDQETILAYVVSSTYVLKYRDE